jgi:Fe-S-cluster containining protein
MDENKGCIKCGKCCYLEYVNKPARLNTLNIKKIEKLTGKKSSEFTDRFPHGWSIYTVLRYIPDQNGDKRCMFLQDNKDGTKTCSIYSVRPSFCKLYPTSDLCVSGREVYSGLSKLLRSARAESTTIVIR